MNLDVNPGSVNTPPFLSINFVDEVCSINQSHVFIKTTPERLRELANDLENAQATYDGIRQLEMSA